MWNSERPLAITHRARLRYIHLIPGPRTVELTCSLGWWGRFKIKLARVLLDLLALGAP